MSKKNRCYLCGGKLSDGYCADCGLDNTKLQRVHYHLNESNAARRLEQSNKGGADYAEQKKEKKEKARIKPVAVSSERTFAGAERRKENKRGSMTGYSAAGGQNLTGYSAAGGQNLTGYTSTVSKKKKTTVARQRKNTSVSTGKVKLIIGCIGIIVAVGGFFYDFIEEKRYEPTTVYYDDHEEYDPYEYLDRELSETGEFFEIELSSGEYLVGVHLPEGNYTAELIEGSGGIDIEDNENGIYLWKSFGTDEEYDEVTEMEDIRLFQGARVEVSNGVKLKFTTENGQTERMEAISNPLTEEVVLKQGQTLTAGEDFKAGVYDVKIASGWTVLAYNIPTDAEYVENGVYERSIWLDIDESDGSYRNLVLPKGTVISSEEEEVILIPSESIGTIDYSEYYEY